MQDMPQENSNEGDGGADQGSRIFEENGEDAGIFAADDFIPDALIGVLTRLQLGVGDVPRIGVESGRKRENQVIPTYVGSKLGVT